MFLYQVPKRQSQYDHNGKWEQFDYDDKFDYNGKWATKGGDERAYVFHGFNPNDRDYGQPHEEPDADVFGEWASKSKGYGKWATKGKSQQGYRDSGVYGQPHEEPDPDVFDRWSFKGKGKQGYDDPCVYGQQQKYFDADGYGKWATKGKGKQGRHDPYGAKGGMIAGAAKGIGAWHGGAVFGGTAFKASNGLLYDWYSDDQAFLLCNLAEFSFTWGV